jgi:hypothetical protein
MPDIYLRVGLTPAADIALRDPTAADAGGTADVVGDDALSVTDAGVVVALWVDSDAVTFADTGGLNFPIVLSEGTVTIALDGLSDALSLSEASSGTAITAALDSTTVGDTGSGTALSATTDAVGVSEAGDGLALVGSVDSGTLADDGVVSVAAGTEITDSDSATMAEVEALLATLDDTDLVTVGEASDRQPPDVSTVVPDQLFGLVSLGRRLPEPVEDDEDALLAAYVGWYD